MLYNRNVYLPVKSLIDFAFAVLLFLLCLPIILLLGLLIYLDNPGPVFFLQKRVGEEGALFIIYKFRTMLLNTPNISTEEMQSSGIKPFTRLGLFLRKTSLDEIPQFINIIKGEMSFIGPRPPLPTQTEVIEGRMKCGAIHLRPGITGYAQATGRDDLTDEEKVQRDCYYYNNLSFVLDIKIIFLTLKSLITNKGNR